MKALGRTALTLHMTVNQIVLDTAPRDRADDIAVLAQGEDRADRTRRGAPGAHHRGEQGAATGKPPVTQGSENRDIEVFHGRINYGLGRSGQGMDPTCA